VAVPIEPTPPAVPARGDLGAPRHAYFQYHARPSAAQVKFWLLELRTPQLLSEVAQAHAVSARRLAPKRPLLRHAAVGKLAPLENALAAEENEVRIRDKAYWSPLLKELESLRHP
jgi:hypothetical protein